MRMEVVMLSDLKVALHRLSFGDSQVDLVPVLSWVSNTDRSTSPQIRGRWRTSYYRIRMLMQTIPVGLLK